MVAINAFHGEGEVGMGRVGAGWRRFGAVALCTVLAGPGCSGDDEGDGTPENMFDNPTAGSGAVAVAAAAMALKTQTLPARINTTNPIDGLMAGAAPSQSVSVRSAAVISCGMGGQNAVVILRA